MQNDSSIIEKARGQIETILLQYINDKKLLGISYLLKQKYPNWKDNNNVDSEKGYSALCLAVERGWDQGVRYFLDNGHSDINLKTNDGYTALMLAAKKGHVKVVADIITRGANINESNSKDSNKTALMYAIESGNLETTKLILNKINNQNNIGEVVQEISAKDEKGKTALIYAIERGNIDIVRALISNKVGDKSLGANVNDYDKNKKTALMYAIETGNLEIVQLLIERSAYSRAKDINYKTVLMYAIEKGNLAIIELILSRINEQDMKIHYNEMGAKDNTNKTVLRYAVESDSLDIVKLIVDKIFPGANVNDYDKNKKTVLMYAIEKGNLDIVNFLLERNAYSLAKDINDKTVLMYAIESGNLDIVKSILNCINQTKTIKNSVVSHLTKKDKITGDTALMYAIKSGDMGIAKALLETIKEQLEKKVTSASERLKENINEILEFASKEKNERRLSLISEYFPNNLPINEIRRKPLTKKNPVVLMRNNSLEASNIYLQIKTGTSIEEVKNIISKCGGEINDPDSDGKSLLIHATESDNKDMVDFILARMKQLVNINNDNTDNYSRQVMYIMPNMMNALDKTGKAALIYAIEKGNIEIVKTLVDNEIDQQPLGANVNTRDVNDKTALMYAIEKGNIDIVNFLLERNACSWAQDKGGKTVLMYAIEKGDIEIIKKTLEKIKENIDNKRTPQEKAQFVNKIKSLEVLEFAEKSSDHIYGHVLGYFKSLGIVNLDNNFEESIYSAAKAGDCEKVKEFMKKEGFDIDAKDNHDKTVLMYAIESGNLDIVKLLVNKQPRGANVNIRDGNEKTALMYALEMNTNTNIIDLLLEKNACSFAKDKTGKTVLMYAIERGGVDIIRRIGKMVGKIDLPDKYGKTPLMYAIEKADNSIITFLLQKGAKINAKDDGGKTVLMYAVERGAAGVLNYLLEEVNNKLNNMSPQEQIKYIADITATDKEGKSVSSYVKRIKIKAILDNFLASFNNREQVDLGTENYRFNSSARKDTCGDRGGALFDSSKEEDSSTLLSTTPKVTVNATDEVDSAKKDCGSDSSKNNNIKEYDLWSDKFNLIDFSNGEYKWTNFVRNNIWGDNKLGLFDINEFNPQGESSKKRNDHQNQEKKEARRF